MMDIVGQSSCIGPWYLCCSALWCKALHLRKPDTTVHTPLTSKPSKDSRIAHYCKCILRDWPIFITVLSKWTWLSDCGAVLTWNEGSWIWIVSLWFPLFLLVSAAHPVILCDSVVQRLWQISIRFLFKSFVTHHMDWFFSWTSYTTFTPLKYSQVI